MQILKKWDGLRAEIAKYCKEHKISEKEFRFLGMYEWENVYNKVLEHFVDGQYARRTGLYWSNINGGFRKELEEIYCFVMGQEGNASYEWLERVLM